MLNKTLTSEEELDKWLSVGDLACRYAIKASSVFAGGVSASRSISFDPDRSVWYNPATESIWFSWSPQDNDYTKDSIKYAFATVCDKDVKEIHEEINYIPDDVFDSSWMKVKLGADLTTILKPIGQTAGWIPGGPNAIYGPIGPSPLSAMIGTGLLGAGGGYLGGALLEKLLPAVFEKNKLRKRTALLGGILGTLPGLWWGSANVREGKSFTDSWPHESTFKKTSEYVARLSAGPIVTSGQNLAPSPLTEEKRAAVSPLYAPIIPVTTFTTTVWNDPYTPPAYRAAVSGLVDAASMSRGGVELVSPYDIGRIAIGAGSGYVSGLLVGKVLGALAGITPEAQKTLQRAGTWAGIVSNIVPLAFGG